MNRNLKIGHKSAFFALLALLLLPGLAGAGELLEKARRFDNLVAAEHIPRGLVVNLQPIEDGQQLRYRSAGDSTIWTGAYIAAQVYRYRVTSDTAALDNLEKALRAFVQLHEMAGSTGFVGRGSALAKSSATAPTFNQVSAATAICSLKPTLLAISTPVFSWAAPWPGR
ncbi:hypothetical protein MASR1M12_15880 [Erysipelotrichia bacterium]